MKLAGGQRVKGVGRERIQRGGMIDIVRSGRTERMARAASIVRTFPTKAYVSMSVPSYVSLTPKDPSKPRQASEMTRVTMGETRTLRRYWQRIIKRELTADRQRLSKKL